MAARLSAGAAAGVVVICIAVLAGWTFGIERFMTVLPGSIRMKPNTAIALMCAAVALLLEWRQVFLWLRRLSAAVPLLFGALTLFEYVSGMAVGIDQLFFQPGDRGCRERILRVAAGKPALASRPQRRQ